jgi:hypothetical protein
MHPDGHAVPEGIVFVRVRDHAQDDLRSVRDHDLAAQRIYTDGRDWPKDPDPTFTGY